MKKSNNLSTSKKNSQIKKISLGQVSEGLSLSLSSDDSQEGERDFPVLNRLSPDTNLTRYQAGED